MYWRRFSLLVSVTFIVTLNFWSVSAADDKYRAPATDVSIEKKQRATKVKEAQEAPSPVLKLQADVRIQYVYVWPKCSAGPGISVNLKNKGPSTAYDILVMAIPEKRGIPQKAIVKELRPGWSRGPDFFLEGGSPVTVEITESAKYHDPNTSNNSCRVDTEIPTPCSEPEKRCPKISSPEYHKRCIPFKFNCFLRN